MELTNEAREKAATVVERNEVFENEKTIFFTYEVDPEYKSIVVSMASAIWDHDKPRAEHGLFPTGSEEIDAPYLCRADDALRAAIPLLRAKIANELRTR